MKWRPSFSVSAVAAARADPVEEILFSFVDNQLYRLVIDYDRHKTDGMTVTDLIEAISVVYGDAARLPGAGLPANSASGQDEGVIVARWTDADDTVDLLRASYGDGFRLMLTSKRLDAVVRKAVSNARRLDDLEAPQRELARLRQGGRREARCAGKSQDREQVHVQAVTLGSCR